MQQSWKALLMTASFLRILPPQGLTHPCSIWVIKACQDILPKSRQTNDCVCSFLQWKHGQGGEERMHVPQEYQWTIVTVTNVSITDAMTDPLLLRIVSKERVRLFALKIPGYSPALGHNLVRCVHELKVRHETACGFPVLAARLPGRNFMLCAPN